MISSMTGRKSTITALIATITLISSLNLVAGVQPVRLEQVVFALLIPIFFWRDSRWLDYPVIRATLFVACSFLASVIFSVVILKQQLHLRDLTEFLRLLMFAALYLGVRLISKEDDEIQKSVVRSVLCAGTAVILFSFAQYWNLLHVNNWLTGIYTPQDQLDGLTATIRRVVGTFGNPNAVGVFFVLIWLLALEGLLCFKDSWRKMAVYALVAGLSLLALVLTVSRTAFLALIISSMFLLVKHLLREHASWKVTLLSCFSVAVVGLVLWHFAPADFVYRMKEAMNVKTSTSIQWRFAVWKDAWDYVKLSPVFGWGPAKSTMPVVLDNEYLLILRRYGLLGLGTYIMFFATMFREAGKGMACEGYRAITTSAFKAWLVAIMVYNLSAGAFYNMQIMSLVIVFAGLTTIQRSSLSVEKGKYYSDIY